MRLQASLISVIISSPLRAQLTMPAARGEVCEPISCLSISATLMPGRLLKVTALDPAAPIDLPAWCRLTGNELVRHEADSKSFWIKSRMNWS